MKKEGRSRTAGRRIAGEYCSPDTWRRVSWGGGECGLVGRVEGERGNDGGRRVRAEEGSGRGLAGVEEHEMLGLLPPSSFFSISFSRLVKNFTKRNFIFPSYPSPAFARHGAAGPPHPDSSSNTYVPITFFFCL